MDRLPEELLVNIFECLIETHLRSVALVSRKFSRLATPLLYARLIFMEPDSDRFILSQSQLLRTLVARPDLASHVDYLGFMWWYAHDAPSVSLGDLTATLEAAATRFKGSILHPELRLQMEEVSTDAVVALVLGHLPHLKTLRLKMVPFNEEIPEVDFNRTLTIRSVEAAIAPSSLGGASLLSNLTYIMLEGRTSEEYDSFTWDIRILSLFLRLPSLRTLTATDAQCDDSKVAGWACEPKTSNVDRIMLWDCSITLDALVKVLRSCKALDTLHWHTTGNERCASAADTRLRRALTDELATHSTSLTYLSLRTARCCNAESAVVAAPGSFGNYPGLEYLSLGEGRLEAAMDPTRFELPISLPPNLSQLKVCLFEAWEGVVEKAASMFASVPALERFEPNSWIDTDLVWGQWMKVRERYPEFTLIVGTAEEGDGSLDEAHMCFLRTGLEVPSLPVIE